jgi:proteasome lid subunit RPN8/RPN11
MEWLAYLLGDKESMIVKDIFVPEQSASSALVDDVECAEFNNLSVIGVMHSHHGMGTGFSGTDHKYVNQNHDISLVVAHSGIAGQVRSKVPCGALMITEAKVKLRFSVDGFEADKFISKVKPNIKKKVYSYVTPSPRPPYQQQNWQQGKPGSGSGYWYNGKWHRSDPIKETDPKEDEENLKEIEEIHKSQTGTAAHYWNCPHCQQQNYTLNTRICWKCKKHKTPQTGAWMCGYCKGVNNRMDSTTCIFCKTVRAMPKSEETSLEEKNQKKIEEEWNKEIDGVIEGDGKVEVDTSGWTSGIPQKHLGLYTCGRCQGKWEDVDLRKFTECPNCDSIAMAGGTVTLPKDEKTLEEELKQEFDKADKEIEKTINDLKEAAEEEKKRLNISATGVNPDTKTTTNGQPAAGTDTHHCRICKMVVTQANTVHKACLVSEQGEGDYPCKYCGKPIGVPNAYHVDCFEKKQAGLKPEDDIWQSEVNEPVV